MLVALHPAQAFQGLAASFRELPIGIRWSHCASAAPRGGSNLMPRMAGGGPVMIKALAFHVDIPEGLFTITRTPSCRGTPASR